MDKERLIAIKNVLMQRGKFNYELSCLERWFYSLKAVICLVLNRRTNYWAKDCIDSCIDSMAIWNITEWQSPDGTAYDWTELAVGIGVLKEWYFDIYRNGSV